MQRPDGQAMLTNDAGEVTSHINGLLMRTTKMLECGIKPLYVFDGKPPELKKETLEERKERREESEAALAKAKEEGDEEVLFPLLTLPSLVLLLLVLVLVLLLGPPAPAPAPAPSTLSPFTPHLAPAYLLLICLLLSCSRSCSQLFLAPAPLPVLSGLQQGDARGDGWSGCGEVCQEDCESLQRDDRRCETTSTTDGRA
eukprot:757320-Hanusia_phi.AAC.1